MESSDKIRERAELMTEARILEDKRQLLRKWIAFVRKWGGDVYDEMRASLSHLMKAAGNPPAEEIVRELTDELKKTRQRLKLKLEKLQEET